MSLDVVAVLVRGVHNLIVIYLVHRREMPNLPGLNLLAQLVQDAALEHVAGRRGNS